MEAQPLHAIAPSRDRARRSKRARSRFPAKDKKIAVAASQGNDHWDKDDYLQVGEDDVEWAARCLIMMANSQCDFLLPPKSGFHSELLVKSTGKKPKKFSDVRYNVEYEAVEVEVANKSYECRSCSKKFGSFRALGGHRASCHTAKFKSGVEEVGGGARMKRLKGHECAVCHRVFSSGQALGGHKRSHSTPSFAACSLSDLSNQQQSPSPQRPRKIELIIDLNLPPPPAAAEEEYCCIEMEDSIVPYSLSEKLDYSALPSPAKFDYKHSLGCYSSGSSGVQSPVKPKSFFHNAHHFFPSKEDEAESNNGLVGDQDLRLPKRLVFGC